MRKRRNRNTNRNVRMEPTNVLTIQGSFNSTTGAMEFQDGITLYTNIFGLDKPALVKFVSITANLGSGNGVLTVNGRSYYANKDGSIKIKPRNIVNQTTTGAVYFGS